jgi:DNA polymerase-1
VTTADRVVRIAVAQDQVGPGGRLQPLDEHGRPVAPPEVVRDLAPAVAAHEERSHPRWIWASTDDVYARLVDRLPVRLGRCHDLRLVESLLLGHAEAHREPRSLGACWARLHDLPVPDDPRTGGPDDQPSLFAADRHRLPADVDQLTAVVAVYADQLRRISAADAATSATRTPTGEPAATTAAGAMAGARAAAVSGSATGPGHPTWGAPPGPGRSLGTADPADRASRAGRAARADGHGRQHPHGIRLLCAAESAGALAAVEMGNDGLPWSAAAHDDLLTSLLGPRPHGGARPELLAQLAAAFQEAIGRPVNPDSPAQVLSAFARVGVTLTSTRSHVLRDVGHPAAALLLRYKELSRIHSAHGWAWREAWVRDGRFRPEYVVGGVVSGRWASRGGGALQIPRLLRSAVLADPGHRLVVADAGQLEPRVLAAMSGDRAMAQAAAGGDLYAGLARTAFDGDRARAKIGLLAAMYGQTSGGAGQLLAILRRRFPDAMDLVETAARTGEAGGVVRSQLGRTSPRPSSTGPLNDPDGLTDDLDGGDSTSSSASSAARARSWGRFTRNFVIQASAADWALALLAFLRGRLAALAGADPKDPPRLVFFQHDEVIVHTPEELAPAVADAITASAAEATRLVFGPTPVLFPLDTRTVECYADAKDPA